MRTGRLKLNDARQLPGNPRGGHRVTSLVRSILAHGFGAAVTVNETTGHTLAGNGRLKALRKIKKDGHPPPAGVEKDGKAWTVPAVFGTWPAEEERRVALALNGGLNGSLEGALDGDEVADILNAANAAAVSALGITENDAAQFLNDHATPYLEPQINLTGLDRAPDAEAADDKTTLKLLLPHDLAAEARQLLIDGLAAVQLITDGLAQCRKTHKKD